VRAWWITLYVHCERGSNIYIHIQIYRRLYYLATEHLVLHQRYTYIHITYIIIFRYIYLYLIYIYKWDPRATSAWTRSSIHRVARVSSDPNVKNIKKKRVRYTKLIIICHPFFSFRNFASQMSRARARYIYKVGIGYIIYVISETDASVVTRTFCIPTYTYISIYVYLPRVRVYNIFIGGNWYGDASISYRILYYYCCVVQ